ncbi:MAG: hypothetical protein HZA54_18520 [Planctomycetes bacterium]|nr:hypothetical protein [Planctomycetota bacterium]
MICLSFETDGCSDELIDEALRLSRPVPGRLTFFCASRYPGLTTGDWRGRRWELALSPAFASAPDPAAELDRLMREMPEAVGLRARDGVAGHAVLRAVGARRLRYTSNTAPLFQAGLAPYPNPWGSWELPMYYMDDLDFVRPDHWPGAEAPFSPELLHRAVKMQGLYVFAFHPLHLALNTPGTAWHQANAAGPGDLDGLARRAFPGRGVRTFFLELADLMQRSGSPSFTLAEALDLYAARLPTGVWEGR